MVSPSRGVLDGVWIVLVELELSFGVPSQVNWHSPFG